MKIALIVVGSVIAAVAGIELLFMLATLLFSHLTEQGFAGLTFIFFGSFLPMSCLGATYVYLGARGLEGAQR